MNKLKIAAVIAALLLAVGVGYKLAPVQPAKTETVFVDKVVYKDRVVTKDVVRTETRSDGTTIVTESTEHSETKTQTHETKTSTTVVSNPLTQYSLGVSTKLDPFNPLDRSYQVELGKRLWSTQVWGTLAVEIKPEPIIWVGVRLEI